MDDALPMWPIEKLGLLSGYNYERVDNRVATPASAGPGRERLTSRTPMIYHNFKITLDSAQLLALERFYYGDLNHGLGWFKIPLRSAAGINLTKVKFLPKGFGKSQAKGLKWSISLKLMTYQNLSVTLDDETVAAINELGTEDLQRAAEIIHTVVHEDW